MNASEGMVNELAVKERQWAVAAHLSSLVNLVGIPSPLGPLVVWLLKRDELAFASDAAKASLNFALSVWIYGAAFLILGVLLIFSEVALGLTLGILLLLAFCALLILNMVFSIVGAIRASEGKTFLYPFNLNLIK